MIKIIGFKSKEAEDKCVVTKIIVTLHIVRQVIRWGFVDVKERGININNIRYMDDILLMANKEEKLQKYKLIKYGI